jgi:hypothetical protein
MNQKNVQAEVSQHSREVGRMPVAMRYEQAANRREQLVREKREIETALSELEAEKRDETSMLLKRHGSKSSQIVGTMDLESKYRRQKADLVRKKLAVEVELGDIKRHLKDRPRPEPSGHISDKVVMLVRIEALLTRVVELLENRP